MRTIRNMPDTLVGGFSKILLGKGPLKEPTFLEVNNLEVSRIKIFLLFLYSIQIFICYHLKFLNLAII